MDSQGIDRTSNSSAAPIQYMGVDHDGFHIFVTEQFLNGSDILAILKHMCGIRLTEGVIGRVLDEPRLADCVFDDTLDSGLISQYSA